MAFVPLSVALGIPRERQQSVKRRLRVYALSDSRDGLVRYVGVTSHTLAHRVAWHIEKPTNHGMWKWIDDLRNAGLIPKATVLEFVTGAEWQSAERGWIAWFRARGDLLNVDIGGIHRDKSGRPIGQFVGKFQEPQSAFAQRARKRERRLEAKGRKGKAASQIWDRVHHPMRVPGDLAAGDGRERR